MCPELLFAADWRRTLRHVEPCGGSPNDAPIDARDDGCMSRGCIVTIALVAAMVVVVLLVFAGPNIAPACRAVAPACP